MSTHPTSDEHAHLKPDRASPAKAEKAAWREQVERHFGALLAQYGFTFTKAHTWVWDTSVEYATATTTFTVERSLEYQAVRAWVQHKPDWPLPGQPVYTTMNLTHGQVSIALIISLRARQRAAEFEVFTGLSDEAIEGSLALFAEVLATYGDDLLRGDFTQIGQQIATMYDDVPPREPVITLWIPEGTDKPQREAWLTEVRRRSPTIRVIYRTYEPRRRRTRQGSQKATKPSGPASP